MKAYVCLIVNGDLCFIGATKSLETTQTLLRPGKLLASLKTNDYEEVRRKLHARYKDARVPSSDYFRLTKSQIRECKLLLRDIDGRNYFQPLFRGFNLLLAYAITWIVFSGLIIKFAIDPIFNFFT